MHGRLRLFTAIIRISVLCRIETHGRGFWGRNICSIAEWQKQCKGFYTWSHHGNATFCIGHLVTNMRQSSTNKTACATKYLPPHSAKRFICFWFMDTCASTTMATRSVKVAAAASDHPCRQCRLQLAWKRERERESIWQLTIVNLGVYIKNYRQKLILFHRFAMSGLENRRWKAVGIRCAGHATPSIRKSWH
jgi:hypothetical protein